MMSDSDSQTDQLLARVQGGDHIALQTLFENHRQRLRRLVHIRMDRRLSSRVDASDVLQDTFVEVAERLDKYLVNRPLPFYVWLRKIAWERLIYLREYHITTEKRTVMAEESLATSLPDDSVAYLADQLSARIASPSEQFIQREKYDRTREALAKLSDVDSEVLILRYLEELSIKETSAVLGISENAVSVRQLRAIVRLRALLISSDQRESR